MSRRAGLRCALPMVPVLLAACNGDASPASLQSQNSGTLQPSTPSDSGSSTSTSGTGIGVDSGEVRNWWKVTMTFTAPAGASNAQVFIDPPASNAARVRSQQAQGVAATHFRPSLSMPAAGAR